MGGELWSSDKHREAQVTFIAVLASIGITGYNIGAFGGQMSATGHQIEC